MKQITFKFIRKSLSWTELTLIWYYYPQKDSKYCSAYTPVMPCPEKWKTRLCVMERSDSLLLLWKGTKYSSNHWKWW